MAQAIKSRAGSGTLTGTRFLMVAISTITGVCFTVIAGLSVSAIIEPVRRRHVLSIVIVVVAVAFALLAFRAAKAGYTDKVTFVASMFRGMIGAFAGLFLVGAYLFLFRPGAEDPLAHALGRPASSFTVFRVLIGSVLLGFGGGFVARIRTLRK